MQNPDLLRVLSASLRNPGEKRHELDGLPNSVGKTLPSATTTLQHVRSILFRAYPYRPTAPLRYGHRE
jgi:hypothetical protein